MRGLCRERRTHSRGRRPRGARLRGRSGSAAARRRGAGRAAGGVAPAALAIAKALGARVIVTSSSAAKLERARELGADETIDHARDDVKAAVQELTGGRGADVVVEHVGEATWRTSLDVAAQGGR